MSRDEVRARVDAAYEALVRHDRHLLEVDASERSITGKLAAHLRLGFPGWDVDCEYNRDGHQIKTLDGAMVFPDVIVHQRGTNQNLVVIEAKKSTTFGENTDRDKLRQFKAELGYRFAFAVTFPVGDAASAATASSDVVEVES